MTLLIKGWINFFTLSHKMRLAWKTQTGLSTILQLSEEVHNAFGDVSQILEHPDLSAATTGNLLRIVKDQPTCRKLKLEMVITVESIKPIL